MLARFGPTGVAVVGLAVFAGLAASSLTGDSATFDETAHLPAGWTYLETGDLRLNPEHPPLAKALAALPLVLGDAPLAADFDGEAWRGRERAPGSAARTLADQWRFGYDALNDPEALSDGRDPRAYLTPARSMIVALAIVLGTIVGLWARHAWGPWAGAFAVWLFALSPTMLAHARLVTTDLAAALGVTATMWATCRWCGTPTLRRAAGLGVGLGIALLTKFSTLVLIPWVGVLVVGSAFRGALVERAIAARVRAVVATLGVVAATSIAIVWIGYGLRYDASPDPAYRLPWHVVEPSAERSITGRALLAVRDARVLPEAYVYGAAYAVRGTERRWTYFAGSTSIEGTPAYFPTAFALKTPPAVLALFAVAIAIGLRRPEARGFAWFLLAPAALYFALAMTSSLNLGHRHLAPVYPLLFVWSAGIVTWIGRPRRAAAVAIATTAALAVSTGLAAPGYLGYFNAFAGGADRGDRWFVDSNVDWGQDLARLAAWQRRTGATPLHLAYFGTGDPAAYGVEAIPFVREPGLAPDARTARPDASSWLAVSVTLQRGLYLENDRELLEVAVRSGSLSAGDAATFLRERRTAVDARRTPPALASWLAASGIPPETVRALEDRTPGGLFRALLERPPDARIGTSIRVYRIRPEDAAPSVQSNEVPRSRS